jgi:Peptidase family M23/Glycosyl hydrolase catalytic core
MVDWCSPVGDPNVQLYPPPPWKVIHSILTVYRYKGFDTVHSGDDINLPESTDIGEPVRAIGAGEVVFAEDLPGGGWMGLVVIRHDHDGTFTCSRYAHMKELKVGKGDKVKAGDIIGQVGDPTTRGVNAPFEAHLHFDIAKTGDRTLIDNGKHWVKSGTEVEKQRQWIVEHYQNPASFLVPRLKPPQKNVVHVIVTGNQGVNIRKTRSTKAETVESLARGAVVAVKGGGPVLEENRNWLELADGRGFIAEALTEVFDPDKRQIEDVLVARRGINIDLDDDRFSPADLSGFRYCRFVYRLSQKQGNQNFDKVRDKYDKKIRGYINQKITPIVVLNHEFYGEGAGFNWNEMQKDDPGTLNRWRQLTDRYLELLGTLAGLYKDSIIYQIWNEADSASIAAVGVPPKALGSMIDRSLDKILGIAPNARVITSGLVSGLPDYWAKTHAAMKNSKKLAGVAIHPYGRGPKGQSALYQNHGTTRQLVKAYHDISKHKIWITEWGVLGPAELSDPPPVSEKSVASYIKDFVNDAEGDERIEGIVYFALVDTMHNGYGLLQRDGKTKKDQVWRAMVTV